MRVLIATDHLQGTSESDHHCAVDGEFVVPQILDCPDRECRNCRTGWFGLSTHGVTTTAMVVERPHLTVSQLRRLVHDWLDCNGMVDVVVQAVEAGEFEVDGRVVGDPVVAVDDLVTDYLEEVSALCAAFPVGSVLSRFCSLVCERVGSRAA